MIERTLRYPGHIELMKVLRETGFFSEEPVEVKGQQVKPLDVTAKLLFPKWKLEKEEEEFTLMRVTVRGKQDGRRKEFTYHLLDRYNKETGTSSMSRTTGYTCTAVARLVIENTYNRVGISPPEYVGEEESCFRFVMDYLAARKVEYKKSEV
jgi:saccharopine dehydrogenase-like NADP-dependent oxidoreductase